MNLLKNADHRDFLKLLLSFYGQIPNSQVSKKTQDDDIPAVVKKSQNFLKNQGCKYISLLGVCWGSLVTQKIISTGKFQRVLCVGPHTPTHSCPRPRQHYSLYYKSFNR